MLPQFLLPETTVREAGTGPDVDLGEQQGETLILTLGITRIIEQESIDLSIWGSADGADWGAKPLASFPAEVLLRHVPDSARPVATVPDVRYLRAKWQVNRWGKGDPKPLFTIYLFAQALQRELVMGAA